MLIIIIIDSSSSSSSSSAAAAGAAEHMVVSRFCVDINYFSQFQLRFPIRVATLFPRRKKKKKKKKEDGVAIDRFT